MKLYFPVLEKPHVLIIPKYLLRMFYDENTYCHYPIIAIQAHFNKNIKFF